MAGAPGTVDRFEFGPGRAMTDGTLRLVGQAAREDSTSLEIRRRARELFADLASMDYDSEIEAVWRHILDCGARYMRDPVGVEYITRPKRLDAYISEGLGAEDCESWAGYASALLSAAGLPVLLEPQGRDRTRPDEFRHLAMRVQNPRTGRWLSFDPIGAWAYGEEKFGLGDSLHRPGDPVELWTLDGERIDMPRKLSMLAEALGDCGSGLGDAESTVLSSLNTSGQVASQFGPYGQLVGGIIQIGTGIYSQATGKPVGSLQAGGPVAISAPPASAKAWGRATRVGRAAETSAGVYSASILAEREKALAAREAAAASSGGTAMKVGLGLGALYLLRGLL